MNIRSIFGVKSLLVSLLAIVFAASLTHQRSAGAEDEVPSGEVPMTSGPIEVDVVSEESMVAESTPEPRMIKVIRELCRLLSTSPLTVAEVAEHIGTTTMRFEDGMHLIVEPSIPEFTTAHVTGRTDDDTIQVALELAEYNEHTFHAMCSAFGKYHMGFNFNYRAPADVLFTVDLYPDLPCRCRITALFNSHRGELDGGSITVITLQHYRRLE